MRGRRVLFLAAGVALGLNPSALGLTFVFNSPVGMSQQAIEAFREAGRRWSANFTDDMVVTINIDFMSLGSGVLGSTTVTRRNVQYQNVPTNLRSKLIADAKSADDAVAVASLPNTIGTNGINFLISNTLSNNGETYLDNNGSANNRSFYIPTANARALGINPFGATDASISFSSDYTWDYNPSDGVTVGSLDFVGVAIHEIGHALGYSSVVDIIDGNPGQSEDSYSSLTTLDLFRYSNSSTYGIVRDLSDENTRTKYFSIDGGVTSIAAFSNGLNNGDKFQASHWKDVFPNPPLGIMNPYLTYGTQGLPSENDLMAMDVIGYDRNFTYAWDNAATGNWNKAWNWNTYVVPNNTKITALFDGAGVNPSITLDTSPMIATLSVRSDNVSMNMSGNTLTASELRIGDVAGKTGGLTLAGLGILNANNIYVGGSSVGGGGTGTLSIGAGTSVNSSGTVRIYSSASNRVTISDGGFLSANSIVNQGFFDASAGSLNVTGSLTNSGTATLGGTQYWYPGATLTNSGLLNLRTDLGASSGTGPALTLTAGKANIYSAQHLSDLSLEGGNAKLMGLYPLTVSRFSAISGTLDLNQGGLIVNYSDVSAYAGVNSAIFTGNLFTSFTLNSPITEAAFDNASIRLDSWMGEPLAGYFQILTQYAYVGDVNLDGRVNENDLLAVLANMNHAGTWLDGDVNHDGFVNLTDYNLVLNYQGAGDSAPMLSMMQWSQLSIESLTLIVVPEPGTLGLGLIGGLVFLGRRRRPR